MRVAVLFLFGLGLSIVGTNYPTPPMPTAPAIHSMPLVVQPPPPAPRTVTLSWTESVQLLTTTNLAVPVGDWDIYDTQARVTVTILAKSKSQFFRRIQCGWVDYETLSEYGLFDQITWETNGILTIN